MSSVSYKNIVSHLVYLVPALLFQIVLVAATLLIVRISFGTRGAELSTWSVHAYTGLFDPLYIRSLMITARLAVICTAVTVILAYPFAMLLERMKSALLRRSLVLCLMLPLLMNLLLQSFGWLVLLAPDGVLNRLLISVGIIDRPMLFLFNEFGVAIGLVQWNLPLAIFPIATALSKIPKNCEDAAAILGAGRLNVLLRIILPLSMPGLVAAGLLVFASNMSAFVVPFLLGGRRVSMLAMLIRDQMGPLLDWPLGAANSVVLISISIAVMITYQKFSSRSTHQ